MKKIFSVLIIAGLSLPSFAFAIIPVSGGIDAQPPRAILKNEGRMLQQGFQNASSTKGKLLMKKEELKGSLRGASSTRPMNASSKNASSTRMSPGFCSQIDMVTVAIDGRVTTTENKKTEVAVKKVEKRDDFRIEVDKLRAQNEVKRKTQMEELAKRGTTDTQKTALANFVAAFTKALEAKNKAIDALLVAHRNEIDQAATARKAGMDKALATLRSDIEAAKAKAKADCTSGVQGDTVRSDLKNAIVVAQEKFKKTVASLEKVKDVAAMSGDPKKTELKKIEDTFKKSVEQARNDLKTALKAPKTTPTASTTTQ